MSIRPAYSSRPKYNQRLLEAIAGLTDEQLALRPTPERWPMWATVGHAACQRVFWLATLPASRARRRRASRTRATIARATTTSRPSSTAAQLVEALDSTFRIVEGCLDRWTLEMLDEEIRRPDYGPDWGASPRLRDPARLLARRLALRGAQRDAQPRRPAADRPLGLNAL